MQKKQKINLGKIVEAHNENSEDMETIPYFM